MKYLLSYYINLKLKFPIIWKAQKLWELVPDSQVLAKGKRAKSMFIILISLLAPQVYAQNIPTKNAKDTEDLSKFERIHTDSGFGFINHKGDTIIPVGKYKFLNPLDEQGMILATNHQDKQGYIDINENIIIPFVYDDMGIFSHNLVWAKKNGTFGYLDRQGKTSIDFQFSKAKYFYKPGLAIVIKNQKYGLIDTLGNFKISCAYDEIDYSRENQIAIVKKNRKWAFYFSKTETLTDFEFDKIYKSSNRIPERGHYNTIKELYFNRNIARVKKNDQVVLINKKLETIVNYGVYDKIRPTNYYGFSVVYNENKYGIIDSLGQLKVPLEYDLISTKPSVSYGNDFNTFLLKKNGKYQILNNQAELEIKKEFDKVDILGDNFYLAYENESIYLIDDNGEIIGDKYSRYDKFDEGFLVKSGNKMGVIDYSGKHFLPFVYDSLVHLTFENGLIAQKDGKFGVIDFEENIIIPFDYDYITRAWYHHKKLYKGNLIVQKNKKLGTINRKNEIVIPLKYDGISGWIEYSPDEHYVKKDGQYGMVKPNGEVMIPCEYDFVYYHTTQTIHVVKNGKHGILNSYNETILPYEYDTIIVDINFWGLNSENEEKLIVLKDGKWHYYDLSGKLIAENVAESIILQKYPDAKKKVNYSLDHQLILTR